MVAWHDSYILVSISKVTFIIIIIITLKLCTPTLTVKTVTSVLM